MVPLASGLRLLAVWYRREHPNDKPEVPGPIRRRCGNSGLLIVQFEANVTSLTD